MYSLVSFTQLFWDSCIFLHVSIVCDEQYFIYFILMSSIPQYGNTIICLSIHLLMIIWIVSKFGLLQIKLLWIFVYMCICADICFLFSWVSKRSRMAGSYGRCNFIFLWNTACFPKWSYYFYIQFQLFHSLTNNSQSFTILLNV